MASSNISVGFIAKKSLNNEDIFLKIRYEVGEYFKDNVVV